MLTNFKVLYFDINRMQTFNCEYGHLKGDEFLLGIEEILKDEIYERKGNRFKVFTNNKDLLYEIMQYLDANNMSAGFVFTDFEAPLLRQTLDNLLYIVKKNNPTSNAITEISTKKL